MTINCCTIYKKYHTVGMGVGGGGGGGSDTGNDFGSFPVKEMAEAKISKQQKMLSETYLKRRRETFL